jgi:hypothetical protein
MQEKVEGEEKEGRSRKGWKSGCSGERDARIPPFAPRDEYDSDIHWQNAAAKICYKL